MMELREEFWMSKPDNSKTGPTTPDQQGQLEEVNGNSRVEEPVEEKVQTPIKDNMESSDELDIIGDGLYGTGYSSTPDHVDSGDSFHHDEDEIDYGSD
jgi:hypothetical protein